MKRRLDEVDIVMPVYQEGEGVLRVTEALQKGVKTPFRLLICYDKEEDSTLAALRKLAPPSLEWKAVRNAGLGVHGAVMTGLRFSRSAAVITMPADDTFNASLIDKMCEMYREGAEVVVPSRFMPGGRMVGCPPLKAFLVRCAAWTLRVFARLPVHDPTNGFRLFSKRLLDTARVESVQGWAFSLELLVKAHRLGLVIRELPAQWIERQTGKSRFRVFVWMPIYLRWYAYAFGTLFWFFKKTR